MLTPDRWRDVERAAFLQSRCGGDAELRAEVERLLAADDEPVLQPSLAGRLAADWIEGDRHESFVGRDIKQYRIESLLGSGGMGDVYAATDQILRRRVALKLLPAPFAADAARVRRFTDEACAASALNHPNIVTVHETGEFEGQRFIAIEFIDGETVRARLARGPLPVPDALDIATQMAQALAAAHQTGIVHRDIKPENVMLRRDGYVKVLDFGLAKLPREHGGRAARTGTRLGAVIGTIDYIAPEQAAGAAVDGRADLYSLGVVLHEMITGLLPRDSALGSDPGSSPAPPIPHGVKRILRRLLASDPAARLADAPSLVEALQAEARRISRGASRRRTIVWLSAAAAAVSLAAGVALWRNPALRRAPAAPAATPAAAAIGGATTVAVLPFQTLTLSEADQYLGVGLADAVITQLAGLPQLHVRPTTAVREFTHANVDVAAAAKKLQVQHVVTALVQRDGDRVRVTVQLVDAGSGAQRWADRFDLPFRDLFTLQDSVSQHVAASLVRRLSDSDRADFLAPRQTTNPDAYRLYLQGRYFLARTNRADLERALSLFEQAVAVDPRYALAYGGVASAHHMLALNITQGATPAQSYPLARDAALKALALDPNLAEAHYVVGAAQFHYDFAYPAAEASMRRALALKPNFPELRRMYGWFLVAMGRHAEAIAELSRSRDQDPTAALTYENLGLAFDFAGRTAEALPILQQAVDLEPGNPRPIGRQIRVFELQRRFDEAMAARRAADAVRGQLGEADRRQAIYARSGYRGVLEDEAARGDRLGCMRAAGVNATLDRFDEAFRHLEACVAAKHTWVPLIKVDLTFERLRGDPRFAALLRRIGFE
jgi:TolB-like protein